MKPLLLALVLIMTSQMSVAQQTNVDPETMEQIAVAIDTGQFDPCTLSAAERLKLSASLTAQIRPGNDEDNGMYEQASMKVDACK